MHAKDVDGNHRHNRKIRIDKSRLVTWSSRIAIAATAGCALLPSSTAHAQDAKQIQSEMQQLQQQIQGLESKLNDLATRQADAEKRAADAQQKQAVAEQKTAEIEKTVAAQTEQNERIKHLKPGTFMIGDTTVAFGGYAAAESVYRNRFEGADIGSDYNTGIPFAASPNFHRPEFRGSARQSRLSLLVQSNPEKDVSLSSYVESDFLGSAVTANSRESNSYTPRLRQFYATYDRNDTGFHFLGGQAWSLVTLFKDGLTARKENVPLTIDAQYNVGFNWTRNWQLRATQEFLDKKLTAGLSVESPQAVTGGNGAAATALGGNTNNFCSGSGCAQGLAGAGLLNSTTSYSNDYMPDVIAKIALDPGWGHYELYGIGRAFQNRTTLTAGGGGANHLTVGGGVGAGAILPVIPEKLDFQVSALAGYGIGRYGSAQFPDFTIAPDGHVVPIPEVEALVGIIGHPTPAWDLYAYAGTEQVEKKTWSFSGGTGGMTGYGNPNVNNAGCNIETPTAASCSPFTSSVDQIQLGAWWRLYQGRYGNMAVGASGSYVKRYTFAGIGGSPSTDDTIIMTSFRYYPFQ